MSSTARSTFLPVFSAGPAGSSLSFIVLFICSSHRMRPRRARPNRTHISLRRPAKKKAAEEGGCPLFLFFWSVLEALNLSMLALNLACLCGELPLLPFRLAVLLL
jgi:hypothetical protein